MHFNPVGVLTIGLVCLQGISANPSDGYNTAGYSRRPAPFPPSSQLAGGPESRTRPFHYRLSKRSLSLDDKFGPTAESVKHDYETQHKWGRQMQKTPTYAANHPPLHMESRKQRKQWYENYAHDERHVKEKKMRPHRGGFMDMAHAEELTRQKQQPHY